MSEQEKQYIPIYYGDDTDFHNRVFVTVTINTTMDLSGMTATLYLGQLKKDYTITNGAFEIKLSSNETKTLPLGELEGRISLFDSTNRRRTISSEVPFFVSKKVADGSPISITLDVEEESAVAYVTTQMKAEQLAEEAETAATNAANSATAAAESATSAANSASAAASSATAAGTAKTGAETAESNASTHATNASNSASAASQSATDAANSASQAAQTLENVVHKTGNETVAGDKDFTGMLTAVTPDEEDNSTKVATTAWVQQVAAAAKPWQKPSGWVDIRFGAQDNSIYLLVGHKADFSKYNEFPIKTEVNNSGTYDIYIDGIKKYSAVAGNTETLLNWQTLNLASGFDVTYPEALRTHIIRLTPTVSTNKLEYPSFVKNTLSNVGLLWLHFTTDYKLYIPEMCYAGCNAPVLEAVTSSTGFLKVGWMAYSFFNAASLKEIPIINILDSNADYNYNFYNAKIRKLEYKIDVQLVNNRPCTESDLSQCEEIVNTTQYPLHTDSFANCPKLKRIRGFFSKTFPATMENLFGGDVSMEEMLLDFSEGAQVKKLVIGGTSSVPLPWFKGLTVSASAPFDGASPQLDVAYTGMTRDALVTLFDSLPTVSDSQVCNVTGASGAADLSAADLAIATAKGWTVTR